MLKPPDLNLGCLPATEAMQGSCSSFELAVLPIPRGPVRAFRHVGGGGEHGPRGGRQEAGAVGLAWCGATGETCGRGAHCTLLGRAAQRAARGPDVATQYVWGMGGRSGHGAQGKRSHPPPRGLCAHLRLLAATLQANHGVSIRNAMLSTLPAVKGDTGRIVQVEAPFCGVDGLVTLTQWTNRWHLPCS